MIRPRVASLADRGNFERVNVQRSGTPSSRRHLGGAPCAPKEGRLVPGGSSLNARVSPPDPAEALLDRSFFGHPQEFGQLWLTAFLQGFAFYGAQSLLVLYMADHLLGPGHAGSIWGLQIVAGTLERAYGPLHGVALAAAIFGVYGALCSASPIVGGLIADKGLGLPRTIALGLSLMAVGLVLVAVEPAFCVALAFMIIAEGLSTGLKAQIGNLYAPADSRRADAYRIYILAVLLSTIAGPLVCGGLAQGLAWNAGFLAASAGAAASLLVYLAASRRRPLQQTAPSPVSAAGALSASDWRAVALLAGMLPILALAAVGEMESFNGYLIWGKANIQLEVLGRTLPTAWLASIGGVINIVALAMMAAVYRWRRPKPRRPDEVAGMLAGMLLLAAAPAILAIASTFAVGGHKVSLVWALAYGTATGLGAANFNAFALALYSRLAPPSLKATMVNVFTLHLFLASLLVAGLAGLVTRMSGEAFWLIHSGLIAIAVLALTLYAYVLRRQLKA